MGGILRGELRGEPRTETAKGAAAPSDSPFPAVTCDYARRSARRLRCRSRRRSPRRRGCPWCCRPWRPSRSPRRRPRRRPCRWSPPCRWDCRRRRTGPPQRQDRTPEESCSYQCLRLCKKQDSKRTPVLWLVAASQEKNDEKHGDGNAEGPQKDVAELPFLLAT